MLGEHEEALFLQQYEDLRLVVMAALAYTMGFTPQLPRTDSKRKLDEACTRLGFLCGFNIRPISSAD